MEFSFIMFSEDSSIFILHTSHVYVLCVDCLLLVAGSVIRVVASCICIIFSFITRISTEFAISASLLLGYLAIRCLSLIASLRMGLLWVFSVCMLFVCRSKLWDPVVENSHWLHWYAFLGVVLGGILCRWSTCRCIFLAIFVLYLQSSKLQWYHFFHLHPSYNYPT